jgi:hypothetical protein
MAIQKKEKWTEEEIAALPAGEQDYFERKSGAALSNPSPEILIAKALCALANSGGGHLILGMADDGTIDCVPAIRKGKQSTKDWLEQIIPYSLNYPLQDFRVHEVIPSAPSLIPAGLVVIVIDVGDSALAPHQTAKSKAYYYRAGGRSEPAPHFYLDTLWGRQSFPSAKVARAWLDEVIRPALSGLSNARQMIERDKWRWEVARNSIPGVYPLLPPYGFTNANAEQFFEFYPEIRDILRTHDKALSNLESALKELSDWLVGGTGFETVYTNSTSPASLAALRDLFPQEVSKFDTDIKFVTAMFGYPARERHFQVIADLLINATEPATDRKLFSHFWKRHARFFTSTVREFATYKKLFAQAESRFAEFSVAVERLYGALTEKRRELATRHGEPYESGG